MFLLIVAGCGVDSWLPLDKWLKIYLFICGWQLVYANMVRIFIVF